MLSLRQFDSTMASTTLSQAVSQLREHTDSKVLTFGAHSSDSLPAAIASFAHPIHTGSSLSDVDQGPILNNDSEDREMDAVAPPMETPTGHPPDLGQFSGLEPAAE